MIYSFHHPDKKEILHSYVLRCLDPPHRLRIEIWLQSASTDEDNDGAWWGCGWRYWEEMMKTYWVLAAIFFLCHLFRPKACQHLWINVVWGHKADWLLEIVIIYIFLILIFELFKTQLYTQTWSFKTLVHSTILQWCCLALRFFQQ